MVELTALSSRTGRTIATFSKLLYFTRYCSEVLRIDENSYIYFVANSFSVFNRERICKIGQLLIKLLQKCGIMLFLKHSVCIDGVKKVHCYYYHDLLSNVFTKPSSLKIDNRCLMFLHDASYTCRYVHRQAELLWTCNSVSTIRTMMHFASTD